MAHIQQVVNLIARTVLAATGIVLYEFASESRPGYTYFITAKDGVADPETHQDCPGYRRWHTCCHMDKVNELERPAWELRLARQELDYCRQTHRDWYVAEVREHIARCEEAVQRANSIPAAEQVAHQDCGLDEAIHEYLNEYEVLATTKKPSTCQYCSGNHNSINCPL